MPPGAPVSRSVSIYIDQASAMEAAAKLQKQVDKVTASITKLRTEGKDTTAEVAKLATLKGKLAELGDVMDGKIAPPVRMVRKAVQDLRRELEGMSQDTPGYAAKFREFEQASETLGKLEHNVTKVRSAMAATAGGNKFFEGIKQVALGTIVGNTVQASVQKITELFSNMISGNAKMTDSLSDVEKATGLSERAVGKLNKEISKINTRDATSELRDIAVSLGQMGQDVTKDAVANVDKIAVALSDEFGSGAGDINTRLGILRNNLQDIKTNNYGEDVLHIGNALNVLGAEGLATAPVVTDFASRIAGVGETFGLTAGQILGTSATMQELGIEVERGSTAYVKILQKITTNVAEYAKIAEHAGVSQKEFVDLVNNDISTALVKVAEGAKLAGDSNLTFGKILKDLDADGSGAGEVLSKLANNGDMLAKKINLATGALKDSSSITEEFDKKNNNLAATLEKIEKQMAGAFNNPDVAAGLANYITWFGELIGAVDEVELATHALEAQQKVVKDLDATVSPLLDTYDMLSAKSIAVGGDSHLSADEQTYLAKTITDVADAIPYAIDQVDAYGKVLTVSTDRAREYVAMQKAVLKERNREAIEKTKDTISELEEKVQMYTSAQKMYSSAVKQALEDGETGYAEENANRLAKFNGRLIEAKERLMALRGIMNQLSGDPLLGQDKPTVTIPLPHGVSKADYEKGANAAAKKTNGTIPVSDADAKKAEENLKRVREAIKEHTAEVAAMAADAAQNNGSHDEKEIAAVTEKYRKLLELAVGHAKEVAQLNELQKKELDAVYVQQGTDREKRYYTQSLKDLDDYYNGERQTVQKQYADGIISKTEYNNKLTSLDVDQSQDRVQIAQQYAGKVVKATDDLEKLKTNALAKGIKERERLEGQTDAESVARAQRRVLTAAKFTTDELNARIDLINEYFEKETKNLDANSEQYQLAEAKRDDDILAAKRAHFQAIADMAFNAVGQITNAFSAYYSFMNAEDQQDLARDKQITDDKKKHYKDLLDNKQISEKQYNKEVDKLDKEYAAKEQAEKKKEFNRNKSLNLIGAAIDGAKAITSIWASYGANPIVAGILTGVAAAANAVQLGMIARQKFPEYGKGRKPMGNGGIPTGPSHANNGISLVDGQTGQKVGEMEGDEAILSKATVANNAELVNALLNSSMYNDGKRIDWLNTTLPSMNARSIAASMNYNRMYAMGGFLADLQHQSRYAKERSTNSDSSIGLPAYLMNDHAIAIKEFNANMKKGVKAYIVYSEQQAANTTIEELQRASRLR